MENVERFIDSQLVYSQYWIQENRPEVAGRMFLEAVFILHYVSNTFRGRVAWRAGINLDVLLKRMIEIYLDGDQDVIGILEGQLSYSDCHIQKIYNHAQAEEILYLKLIYGCLSKVLIPHKPDISLLDNSIPFLKSANVLMARSRNKKIICSPDSELDNDQYHARRWMDSMLSSISNTSDYSTLVLVSAITDTIMLSYMQRVSKFTEFYKPIKRLCVNDLLTNTIRKMKQ